MAQSKLCLMSGVRSKEEVEFMQFGTLKLMFIEQVRVHAFDVISWLWLPDPRHCSALNFKLRVTSMLVQTKTEAEVRALKSRMEDLIEVLLLTHGDSKIGASSDGARACTAPLVAEVEQVCEGRIMHMFS